MPELDDHKTDALFQVGANRHDFSYDPAAWENMETLLDAEEQKRRRWMWWYVAMGILVVLLLALAGYLNWKSQGLEQAPIITQELHQNDVEEASNQVTSNAETQGFQEKNTSTGHVEQQGASGAMADQGRSLAPVDKDPLPGATSQKNSTSPAVSGTGLPVQQKPAKKRTNSRQVPIIPTLKEAVRELEPKSDDTVSNNVFNVSSNAISQDQPSDKAILLLPQQDIPLLIVPGKEPALEVKPPTKEIQPVTTQPFITLGLSAGVIFGAVEDSGLGMDQARLGAKIDYHLNSKIALGTGVYFNRVCYRASGENYKVEEGFWTYDVAPESILAQCDVLEIPLSLTIHPWGSNKSGIYFGGGLTTYLMLEEHYFYEYEMPQDDFVKYWKEENANQHYFGVGQFNLGYQRRTGRRSAFQLESFIQLPLQGIGHGQVRLMTVGASVNYTFGFNRKK